MSVRMRHTRSHTNNRRSHHALKAASLVEDKDNGSRRLPHRLDEATGMYRGKQIVPDEALKRREARAQKRQKEAENSQTAVGMREPVHATEDPIAAPKAPAKEGLIGRFTKGRAKARSGAGGGGA